MSTAYLDETHDPALTSWVESANGHPEFPIQNLAMCVFARGGEEGRVGVAIGDMVLDIAATAETSGIAPEDRNLLKAVIGPTLNRFFALPQEERRRFRGIVSSLLAASNAKDRDALASCLFDRSGVDLLLPAAIGDYTDFFAGIHHANAAGRIFRPDAPLLPNYKHIPVAYHGRSSSIRASGHPVTRPMGQIMDHGADAPRFAPCGKLDYELELAMWVRGGNELGTSIPIADAGREIVGFGVLNDWSARDIQFWESAPLGPFLGKNFISTVSPFVVTAEALAPFRTPQAPRPDGDPAPLPYMMDAEDQASGAFAIELEASILTPAMRKAGMAPFPLTRSCALDLYWTPAQMIAHHTMGGCNIAPGDLFGSGTISADRPGGYGSMLELSKGGAEPIELPTGETRTYLEDGDELIMTAWCEREGFVRIGLGQARGTVMPPP